jgi:chromosome segregation and condensation protein ScpB
MVSLDQSSMDKADKDAKRHRLSRSAMIRLAIMAYRPPNDPNKKAGPQ